MYRHRRTRREIGGEAAPPSLKIFRTNSVFQGKRYSCSKILDDKKYCNTVKNSRATVFQGNPKCSNILNDKKHIFITVKIPGQLCFSGQAQVAQKSWIINNIYSVLWIQAPSVFQGKRKLFKTPECKKYTQYSEKFLGNSVFRASAVAQKSWMIKIYSIQWKISGETVFQGKRKLLKSWM